MEQLAERSTVYSVLGVTIVKNVLFLLDYYLPNASANGVCVANIIDELKKTAETITLLCISDKTETIVSDNVTIYKIKEPPQRRKLLSSIRFYIKWLLPSRLPITTRKSWVDLFVENARKIISNNKIDMLVSVHLPIETLVASTILNKEFTNLCMVGYMLDSMSGGHIPRFLPQEYTRWRKRLWEKRIFESFDKLVLMETSYKHNKNSPITNAWASKAVYLNVPLLLPYRTSVYRKTDDEQRIRIAFCGLLDYPYRNVYYIIDVIKRMKTPVELLLVGKSNIADDLSKISGIDNRIVYKGLVQHSEVVKIIEKSDVLLNLGVLTPSAISGKIFEYMSYKKPIITTYSIDDEACIPYIQKYPLGLALDEREKNISMQADLLDKFIEKTLGKNIDNFSIEKEFYTSTPKSFCELLGSIGGGDTKF